nr:hypothetical protein [uncultured Sulfurimonas sp.]
MSSTQPAIKPNNHRVHPCPNDKKLSLLNKLISDNIESKIIVVTAFETQLIIDFLQSENSQILENVQIVDDRTLIKDENLICDLLISMDVPAKAVIYIARLSHTNNRAVLLLNESEQKLLYPIETLLGRVIKQDLIEGFAYEAKAKQKKDTKTAPKKMTKSQITDVAKKRYDEKVSEPKPKREYKKEFNKDDKKDFKKSDKSDKWAKKKKSPNKYLGKDENGKAIFSGKSGERNHNYDGTPKDKYDAPKKTGRKISIKSLKKPTDKKD